MFVGMDLHKNYLQIAVMNENGKVLENSRINNNLKQVFSYADSTPVSSDITKNIKMGFIVQI